MKDFVEECRREWKRLRVPDPVANEMAADLAADLEEAEAEGVSPEELLGSGASDPRSFAASWAAARGVGQRSPASERVVKKAFVLAAIAALVVIAVSGAVLMTVASPSGPRRLVVRPPIPTASAGVVWIAKPAAAQIFAEDKNGSGVDTHAVGSVLLIASSAGIVLLTLLSLSIGQGRWSRRRSRDADPPTGRA